MPHVVRCKAPGSRDGSTGNLTRVPESACALRISNSIAVCITFFSEVPCLASAAFSRFLLRFTLLHKAEKSGFPRVSHAVALGLVVAGAAASFSFMLQVGRHNRSRLLILLFTIWVLSPFVALISAHALWKRLPARTGSRLDSLMLVLTLVSLTIYGRVALGSPISKPAFVFLVVPAASWAVIVVGGLFIRPRIRQIASPRTSSQTP